MDEPAHAIERLYRERYVNFRNALATVTGSNESAKDAVREGFARAFRKRAHFRGEGSLDAWVWRIVLRAAYESRRNGASPPLDELPEAELVEPERDPALTAALRAISPRRRLLVFLHYYADLSYAEIAGIVKSARAPSPPPWPRRGNPSSKHSKPRRAMSTDDLLGTRLAALANPIDDSDWLDVRRRARARRVERRHLAVAGLAAALAIGVAAPAFGLHRAVIDWFQAESAPEAVQLQFSQLAVGAPKGMDPGVIPNSARKVTEIRHNGKVHTLWVAPTKEGGFCKTWTNLFGGCRKSRTPPAMPPGLSPDFNPFLLGLTWSPNERGVVKFFGGDVLLPETARVVAEFADGAEIELPVVWVSPPIDAGFFLYFVPHEHRQPGRHLMAVFAENADGDLLARQTFTLTPAHEIERQVELPDGRTAVLPAKAIVDEARKVIDFRASNGRRVTLWVMPTTDGGRCFTHGRGSGCPREELNTVLALALHSGSQPVLLGGLVRSDVAAVDLHYQDGRVERVTPVERFVLHELPPESYEYGHRLEAVVARDSDGRALKRQAFDPGSPGVYPCEKPVDIGHGVMSCP